MWSFDEDGALLVAVRCRLAGAMGVLCRRGSLVRGGCVSVFLLSACLGGGGALLLVVLVVPRCVSGGRCDP